MPTSLEAKRAYYARTRRSNYEASLRLEGFDTSEEDASKALPSREEVLKRYRQHRQA
ncbi:YhfG family protein [Pseudomonas sp. NPDC007930]|uniref:YhfG family protein n=1 Tax=Pseudomonas sp. NPDC007930 TaxID=3364417 RepID=UPI0036EEDB69